MPVISCSSKGLKCLVPTTPQALSFKVLSCLDKFVMMMMLMMRRKINGGHEYTTFIALILH